MKLTSDELQREAAATGFLPGTLEKSLHLLSLLDTLRSHAFLRTRIALKGGTALNLFVFDVPRLSVDIDLNYIGTPDRETMLAERPQFEQAVQAVCQREGLVVRQMPADHAGGKWRLAYTAASGGPGNLELDINFLLRSPLWGTTIVDSRPLGSYQAIHVPMLDVHEVAAGKLAALLSRAASRDLFDVRELLQLGNLDRTKLRLAFVVYAGANRKDMRAAAVDDVKVEIADIQSELLPMLRTGIRPRPKDVAAWSGKLVTECRELLSAVLPLTKAELEFLERLNTRGEIAPELVTEEAAMRGTLREHPALKWKALNVRKHYRLPEREPAG